MFLILLLNENLQLKLFFLFQKVIFCCFGQFTSSVALYSFYATHILVPKTVKVYTNRKQVPIYLTVTET